MIEPITAALETHAYVALAGAVQALPQTPLRDAVALSLLTVTDVDAE